MHQLLLLSKYKLSMCGSHFTVWFTFYGMQNPVVKKSVKQEILLLTSGEHSSNTPAGAIEKMLLLNWVWIWWSKKLSIGKIDDQKILIEGVIFNWEKNMATFWVKCPVETIAESISETLDGALHFTFFWAEVKSMSRSWRYVRIYVRICFFTLQLIWSFFLTWYST